MYFPILRANLAVMNFLRAAHLAAQQRIELCELRAAWNRYGLRSRDLDHSVARLESLGFVDVDRVRGHQYLVLTEMGHRSAHSMIGLIESLVTVPRRLGHLLGRLKFSCTPRNQCRRQSDRQDRTAKRRARAPMRARGPRHVVR